MITRPPSERCRQAFVALLLPVVLSACGSGSGGSSVGDTGTDGPVVTTSTTGEAPALGTASPTPSTSGTDAAGPIAEAAPDNPFEVPEPGAAGPTVAPAPEPASPPVDPTADTHDPDGIPYCD